MSRAHLIETFNTHSMSAEVVKAVATARELELGEVMSAVQRAAGQPQEIAQHLIVYGERGSGKSFLMRLIEIEIERLAREEALPVVSALLPEEQYNIRSAPQLIRFIASKVRGAGWEAAAFTMDFRPPGEAWEVAIAELNAALDRRFGKGLGLVVAMVENFDTLARSLFGGKVITQQKTASTRAIEQNNAEQLLRKLMSTKGSRLMLIASATCTVDQDYDRPLFQAFKTLDLRIWISDDCIAYFNRRRALERQSALSPQEEARARAIAEFIGGNPRLAQLLGEVLATPDARSITATLDALSDHLADYYRHRIEELPPQSAGLLDALIRNGEPCTQAEMAARVGANSQAQIADAFNYLLTHRLLAAGADKPGASKRYRLRDRLFVHFYRRRYGGAEKASGLAPIAELLESFFTLREREQQTRRHLEAGEWADARLYAMNSRFLSASTEGFCGYRDGAVMGTPSGLFQLAGLTASEAIEAQTELKDHPELAVQRWKETADHANSGLNRTAALLLEAKALSRCQMDNVAEDALSEALENAVASGDKNSQILVLDEKAGFTELRRNDRAKCIDLAGQIIELIDHADNDSVRARALCTKAGYLSTDEIGRYLEAVAASDEAATLALRIGSQFLQARALGHKANSLYRLNRYEEAASVAEQAADLAAAMGATHYQIDALSIMGDALFRLNRHEAAASIYSKAAQLAAGIGDEREQCRLLSNQSFSLYQLKRLEDALSIAREATKLAEKLGDPDLQVWAMGYVGDALNGLHQFAEAATVFEEAAPLAASMGNTELQLSLLNGKVWSLSELNQHESTVELAQTIFELAATAGNPGIQTTALWLKGLSLGSLEHWDQASNAFAAAFHIAKAADLKEQLITILKIQSIILGQKYPEQTLSLAREAIAEMRDASSAENLWKARQVFFSAAARTQASDVVEVFEACLTEAATEENAKPLANMLDEVSSAVAFNDAWDEFTDCLLRHPQALPFLASWSVLDQAGRVWSAQVKDKGRALAYAAIARQLPAIVRLCELLPGERLGEMINGLVNHCDDSGFLEDMAELLMEGFGEKIEAEVQRLRAFAQVHAAPDKEKVLQRLNPDLALAIRRIWGLPEPDDLLAQRGRRKGR